MGVDLFFVISGFLITGILLDSKDSSHYFRNFYVRRALRIWPLYYAVLSAVFCFYAFGHPHSSAAKNLNWGWFYYVYYLQNFFLVDNQVPLLGVTWSLAVEEQFYITWPLVVLLCRPRQLRSIVLTLLLASPVIRLVLDRTVGHYPTITFGRMDGILFGSLLALWFRSETFSLQQLRKWASVLLVVGGIASVYLLTTSRNAGQHSILVYSFLAIAFSGLVGFAAVDSLLPRPVHRFLTNPVLSYIGKISYGLYLLHPVAYHSYDFLVRDLGLPLGRDTFAQDALAFVAELGLAFLFASTSWHFFEQPLLRLKKKFDKDKAQSFALRLTSTQLPT